MTPMILNSDLVTALGWTLLHSLWIAILLAILVKALFFFLPPAKAQIRYLLSLTGLGLIFLAAVICFCLYLPEKQQYNNEVTAELGSTVLLEGASMEEERLIPEAPIASDEQKQKSPRFSLHNLENYFPSMVLIWTLGMFFMGFRLLGNWFYLRQLGRKGLAAVDKEWQVKLQQFCSAFGIQRPVSFYLSSRVREPITLRHFKPLILFPFGLLSQLSPEQVEIILKHELAHIRRWDYLVNWFQSVLEVIFFYHPAVWWLSAQARAAREHSCDDMVLRDESNKRMLYAQTLAQLSAFSLNSKQQLAMSINGKNNNHFTFRVKRLFGHMDGQKDWPKPYAYLVAVLPFIFLLLFFGSYPYAEQKTSISKEETAIQLMSKEGKETTLPHTFDAERAKGGGKVYMYGLYSIDLQEEFTYKYLDLQDMMERGLEDVIKRGIDPGVPEPLFRINDHSFEGNEASFLSALNNYQIDKVTVSRDNTGELAQKFGPKADNGVISVYGNLINNEKPEILISKLDFLKILKKYFFKQGKAPLFVVDDKYLKNDPEQFFEAFIRKNGYFDAARIAELSFIEEQNPKYIGLYGEEARYGVVFAKSAIKDTATWFADEVWRMNEYNKTTLEKALAEMEHPVYKVVIRPWDLEHQAKAMVYKHKFYRSSLTGLPLIQKNGEDIGYGTHLIKKLSDQLPKGKKYTISETVAPHAFQKYGEKGTYGVYNLIEEDKFVELPLLEPVLYWGEKIPELSSFIKEQSELKNPPIFILNDRRVSMSYVSQLAKLKKEELKWIMVLKGRRAVEDYGALAKDGAIVLETKDYEDHPKSDEINKASFLKVIKKHYYKQGQAPLFVFDDKVLGNDPTAFFNAVEYAVGTFDMMKLHEFTFIEENNKDAIQFYGERAKFGVIAVLNEIMGDGVGVGEHETKQVRTEKELDEALSRIKGNFSKLTIWNTIVSPQGKGSVHWAIRYKGNPLVLLNGERLGFGHELANFYERKGYERLNLNAALGKKDYGEEAKDGVYHFMTKDYIAKEDQRIDFVLYEKGRLMSTSELLDQLEKMKIAPLFFLGEEQLNQEEIQKLREIKKEDIRSILKIRPKKAVELYGESAHDGAFRIRLKAKNSTNLDVKQPDPILRTRGAVQIISMTPEDTIVAETQGGASIKISDETLRRKDTYSKKHIMYAKEGIEVKIPKPEQNDLILFFVDGKKLSNPAKDLLNYRPDEILTAHVFLGQYSRNVSKFEDQYATILLFTKKQVDPNELSFLNKIDQRPAEMTEGSTVKSDLKRLEEMTIFPNPSSDQFQLEFFLEKGLNFSIAVFDNNGRYIGPIAPLAKRRGTQKFQWDASQYPNGTYHFIIETGAEKYKRTVVKQ